MMRWVVLALVVVGPMAGCVDTANPEQSGGYLRKDFEIVIFNDGEQEFYVEALTRDDKGEETTAGSWYISPSMSEGNSGWLSNSSNWTIVVRFYMPGPMGTRAVPGDEPSSEESFALNLDTDCLGVDRLVLEVHATMEDHAFGSTNEHSGGWLCDG